MKITPADLQIGQEVYFLDNKGEYVLGKITKLNPKRARIEVPPRPGNYLGGLWDVPYQNIRPDNPAGTPSKGKRFRSIDD